MRRQYNFSGGVRGEHFQAMQGSYTVTVLKANGTGIVKAVRPALPGLGVMNRAHMSKNRGTAVTGANATAEVFWTEFRVLSRKEQQAIIRRLLKDKNLREDLVDLALVESRRREPARPLRKYLADSRRAK